MESKQKGVLNVKELLNAYNKRIDMTARIAHLSNIPAIRKVYEDLCKQVVRQKVSLLKDLHNLDPKWRVKS